MTSRNGDPDPAAPPIGRDRSVLRRAVDYLTTAWLILGVTVALVIALELTYRAQGTIRRVLSGQEAALTADSLRRAQLHPNRETEWWDDYSNGAGWTVRFDPYRGIWPDSVTGRYLRIDTLGRRATFDPTPAVGEVEHIWMFGGSAMFGYLVRDRHTIPSLLAEELHVRGVEGVRVHNLAQSTFNLTQGVSTLVLELRAGRVPDLVVFLDGNNEVAPPSQYGQVGAILNQDRLAERLTGAPPGVADLVTRHFELAERLARHARRAHAMPPPGDAALCPEIASQYGNLTDVVRALASHFDFAAEFYWQPMLATSAKPRTEWEELATTEKEWGAFVRACTAAVDDAMKARGYTDFRTLTALFDGETESVFVDDYGHLTEAANRVVAEALARDLIPVLREHRQRRDPGN